MYDEPEVRRTVVNIKLKAKGNFIEICIRVCDELKLVGQVLFKKYVGGIKLSRRGL